MRYVQHAAIAAVALFMVACATDPVRVAQDPKLKAQAVYAEYVIAEERMVDVLRNPAVPASVKESLHTAHDRTKPIAEGIETLSDSGAITRAQKAIEDFSTSVKKADPNAAVQP